ncbi:YbaB/EbfC family nucleoid-associated protein [Rhodococcus erythropolis]|uniref:YbaB/EbfC family nucleoid-associated protein n=1 Tax=Rhodococcus erythropolis TaxID=1833 RepID=UPI0036DBEEB1
MHRIVRTRPCRSINLDRPASSFPELTVLARQVDAEVGKVRARADAGGGVVSIEVDAYGAITDLQLTESALRVGAAALSASIAAAHRTASASAASAAQELRAPLLRDPRVARAMNVFNAVDAFDQAPAAPEPHVVKRADRASVDDDLPFDGGSLCDVPEPGQKRTPANRFSAVHRGSFGGG